MIVYALMFHSSLVPGRCCFCHSSTRIIVAQYNTMPSSTKHIICINVLFIILLLSQPMEGTGFVPRDVASGEPLVRRFCSPAAPNVNESSVRLSNEVVAQYLLKWFRSLPMFATKLLPIAASHVPTKCGRFGQPSHLRSGADDRSGP